MASIKKINDRKYKITISNGYRSDGKKIAKAKTITVPPNIPVRRIEQYVSHEAEELEREFKLGYCEDADTTFEAYAKGWLSRQTKYAPRTLEFYRRNLERVYPLIGSIPLNKLQPIALENMLQELRKRTYHGKPISEKTVQKYLTAVSAVLSDAKRNEIISKNAARMVALPAVISKEQETPSPEEIERFFSILYDYSYPVRALFFVATYTGCRRGELCALKWDDLTVTENGHGILTVQRSIGRISGKGIVEGTTKNGRSRTIILEPDVVDILEALCYEALSCGIVSEYIFPHENGGPLDPDRVTKLIRRIFDENGFSKSYHFHTLRHFNVTTLLHSGVDKQTVAELAGHGDTSFLERTYCHPQTALKEQAASSMLSALMLLPDINSIAVNL